MKKTKWMRLGYVILALMLVLLMVGCKSQSPKGTDTDTEAPVTDTEPRDSGRVLGEGETTFHFTVTDSEGNETRFEIHTDKKTVGAALTELDLIAGETGAYGLYVKTVNGVTVDYDTDKKYWAFYIDGQYASTGVDSTDIVSGSTYSFKVES